MPLLSVRTRVRLARPRLPVPAAGGGEGPTSRVNIRTYYVMYTGRPVARLSGGDVSNGVRQRSPLIGLGRVRYPIGDGEYDEARGEQDQRHLVQCAPLRPTIQYDVSGEQLESQFAGGRDRRRGRWKSNGRRRLCRRLWPAAHRKIPVNKSNCYYYMLFFVRVSRPAVTARRTRAYSTLV